MAVRHGARTTDMSALQKRFSDLVGALPQARRVLLETTDEGVCLWTVIEARPFDRAQREPVYEAQREVLRSYPFDVEFRLINLAEYGPTRTSDVLPGDAQVVWAR
jgi:hypothetical protein